MSKLSFTSDYAKGAHPKILEALAEVNDEAFGGYGRDRISESAEKKIKEKFECPEGKVLIYIFKSVKKLFKELRSLRKFFFCMDLNSTLIHPPISSLLWWKMDIWRSWKNG